MRDLRVALLLVALPLHCAALSEPDTTLPLELRVERPAPTAPPGEVDTFETRPSHAMAYVARVAVAGLLGMLFAVSIATWAGCWWHRKRSQSRENDTNRLPAS